MNRDTNVYKKRKPVKHIQVISNGLSGDLILFEIEAIQKLV